MELKIQLKPILTQKLIMTPQLQQAIKMLQLSRLELLGKIHRELEENPVLEKDDSPLPDRSLHDAIDFYSYLESYGSQQFLGPDTDGKQTDGFENYTSAEETLTEHLLWQLMAASPGRKEKRIGSTIAGSLDGRGYLKASLEEIASMSGAEVCKVQQVLSLMQTFDPPGVCARDLKECLLIQAGNLDCQDSIVTAILENHLNDLERNHLNIICRALKINLKQVVSALNIIKGFEPIPARQFSEPKTHYIEPDIFVYRMEDDFVIELNNSGMPRLRISLAYKKLLKSVKDDANETRDYFLQKLRSARWMITSIHQREQTIYRVMQSILNAQRDFFEKGISYLKPMVLKDVAEDIGMAESTISRVTQNKYAQTPWGVFSLKYFFSSPISKLDGDQISSLVVQNKIKKIVAEEDPQKPYSDDKIASILKASNIDIARRTVAKYREVMKIPPSRRRKQLGGPI